MRVAFFRQGFGAEKGPGFGGQETQQAETINELKKLGLEVVFDWQKANIVHIFGIYRQTPEFIKTFKAMGKKVAVSTIYWDWAEMGHRPRQIKWAEDRFKFCFDSADLLLPNSHAEARLVHKKFAQSMEKMRVVVNAVPADILKRAEGVEIRDGDLCGLKDYVLIVGRIEGRKGQARFLYAMRTIPVPILMIGDCYENAYFWTCHEMAQMRRARTEIFIGIPPPEIYAYMKKAMVVVQPSVYETPGLVCLEAAALGVPVAPTNRGSAEEYFGTDVTYVDPFNDENMRNCLKARDSDTTAIQKKILGQYTWTRAAEQTLAAYQEFMKESL